jgi:proteasome assembly chaperone (PAC2) family protein
MEHVQWTSRPVLRAPVVVAAFTGWNDAGDAASTAVRHLVAAWGAQRVASIDPEEFFDFQTTRPMVRLTDGITRHIQWPTNDVWAAAASPTDVLLLAGTEPQLRWRTFCRQVTEVAKTFNARLVITMGALLADVSHAHEVPVMGTATDQDLIDRFDLARSRYEGPTGIVGVLQEACGRAGLPSASLWAAVPAYAPGLPSPKATLALVRRVASIVGLPVALDALAEAAAEYEREVTAMVDSDDDIAAYVRRLEEGDTDDDPADQPVADDASVEGLVEDIERYLRDQGRE